MDTTFPILPGLDKYEMTLSGPSQGQPEYQELKILRSPDGRVITRWTFTEEERRAIAEGADLFLTTMTFNQNFQPIRLDVGSPQPGVSTEGIKRDMRLDDQAELMVLLGAYNQLAKDANDAKLALARKQQEVFAPAEPSKIALVQ